MHYKNGREAKIGDLVRGRGYNLKHEFTGVVIELNATLASCNVTLATAAVDANRQRGMRAGEVHPPEAFLTKEYGQLDAFVAIDPATGEELPKEGA